MKKAAVALLSASLLLTACGNGSDSAKKDSSTKTEAVKPDKSGMVTVGQLFSDKNRVFYLVDGRFDVDNKAEVHSLFAIKDGKAAEFDTTFFKQNEDSSSDRKIPTLADFKDLSVDDAVKKAKSLDDEITKQAIEDNYKRFAALEAEAQKLKTSAPDDYEIISKRIGNYKDLKNEAVKAPVWSEVKLTGMTSSSTDGFKYLRANVPKNMVYSEITDASDNTCYSYQDNCDDESSKAMTHRYDADHTPQVYVNTEGAGVTEINGKKYATFTFIRKDLVTYLALTPVDNDVKGVVLDGKDSKYISGTDAL